MVIDHPTTITLRSLLNYVQIWPDIANKFLIAYENFIQVDSAESKYFNRNSLIFFNLNSKDLKLFHFLLRNYKLFQ
jgi:hypothetical protein